MGCLLAVRYLFYFIQFTFSKKFCECSDRQSKTGYID